MSSEYEIEPIPGLPEALPAGEHIIWQGSPVWQRLAQDAFKARWIAAYFIVILLWALIDGNNSGLLITLIIGSFGTALLYGLGYVSARSTLYTITNKRVVMRYGIALPKCVNLPMVAISAAGVRLNKDGSGDIPLTLSGAHRLGYLQFWPHARPWEVAAPQPMLRAIPAAANVAALLSEAMIAEAPGNRGLACEMTTIQTTRKLVVA